MLDTGLLNHAAIANMGEAITLTVGVSVVVLEGVFVTPWAPGPVGGVDVDQPMPAVLFKTADLAELVAQPAAGDSITRGSGKVSTIYSVKAMDDGMTRLELREY